MTSVVLGKIENLRLNPVVQVPSLILCGATCALSLAQVIDQGQLEQQWRTKADETRKTARVAISTLFQPSVSQPETIPLTTASLSSEKRFEQSLSKLKLLDIFPSILIKNITARPDNKAAIIELSVQELSFYTQQKLVAANYLFSTKINSKGNLEVSLLRISELSKSVDFFDEWCRETTPDLKLYYTKLVLEKDESSYSLPFKPGVIWLEIYFEGNYDPKQMSQSLSLVLGPNNLKILDEEPFMPRAIRLPVGNFKALFVPLTLNL